MDLINFNFSGIIYGLVISNNDALKHEFPKKEFQFAGATDSELNTDLVNKLRKELASANDKIELLENKMQGFEERIRKPYPNVKYLNYRTKRRILVQ